MGENFPESERTKKARRKAGFYEKKRILGDPVLGANEFGDYRDFEIFALVGKHCRPDQEQPQDGSDTTNPPIPKVSAPRMEARMLMTIMPNTTTTFRASDWTAWNLMNGRFFLSSIKSMIRAMMKIG
jgi:hypothetical protein